MKSVNEWCKTIEGHDGTGRENERGNTVYDMHYPDERYRVDFADDFGSEGWEQFDTDQDAPYFGVWMNKTTRRTLTYAEGDWMVVTCSDDEHYNAEVLDAIRFYGEGRIARVIGNDGSAVDYGQDRARFLIGNDEPQNNIGDVLAVTL